MRISIALCTYNGERFLSEQLESIVEQSRLPDELVICDDGSSDKTLKILEDFATSAPFPVYIFRNDKNLGSTKNFEKAISLCNGEIIALADQDDVWLSEKLNKIKKIFLQSSDTGVVFTDADVVDANLSSLGFGLWESVGFTPEIRKAFLEGSPFRWLLRQNIVTGATMAFRSNLRNLVLPISSYWIHDGWIALLASFVTGVTFIDEKLILYRQHDANQIGARKRSEEAFLTEVTKAKEWGPNEIYSKAKVLASVHARLAEAPATPSRRNDLEHLRALIMHLLIRRSIHKHRISGIPRSFYELLSGHYHRYSKGLKSFAKDIAGDTW